MRKFIIFLIGQLCLVTAHADTVQQLETQVQAGKFAHAATTGLSLLMHQPDDTRIRFLTALALQKNQQPEQAIRHYKTLIDQHPDLPEPRNNLAVIYLQQGKHEAAVEMLESALNNHPAYATTWQNLTSIYQALASQAYNKALGGPGNTQETSAPIELASLDRLHQRVVVNPETTILSAPVQTAVAKPAPTQQRSTAQTGSPTDEFKLRQVVESTLQTWATAWSNQEFERYIDTYTADYRGRQDSHAQWVAQRRSKIVGRRSIEVGISDFSIQPRGSDKVVVDFVQAYRSDNYRDRVLKRLHLVKRSGVWKIRRELTLAVL